MSIFGKPAGLIQRARKCTFFPRIMACHPMGLFPAEQGLDQARSNTA